MGQPKRSESDGIRARQKQNELGRSMKRPKLLFTLSGKVGEQPGGVQYVLI